MRRFGPVTVAEAAHVSRCPMSRPPLAFSAFFRQSQPSLETERLFVFRRASRKHPITQMRSRKRHVPPRESFVEREVRVAARLVSDTWKSPAHPLRRIQISEHDGIPTDATAAVRSIRTSGKRSSDATNRVQASATLGSFRPRLLFPAPSPVPAKVAAWNSSSGREPPWSAISRQKTSAFSGDGVSPRFKYPREN